MQHFFENLSKMKGMKLKKQYYLNPSRTLADVSSKKLPTQKYSDIKWDDSILKSSLLQESQTSLSLLKDLIEAGAVRVHWGRRWSSVDFSVRVWRRWQSLSRVHWGKKKQAVSEYQAGCFRSLSVPFIVLETAYPQMKIDPTASIQDERRNMD